ncbi:MAG: methyltransferase family protein [Promethearchaeota archaeon]|jgi:protein-S-isoprenylcysteine O-methyltransferase Ste14
MNNREHQETFPLLGVGPKILLTLCPFLIFFGILNALFPLFQIPIGFVWKVSIGFVLIIIGVLVFIYSEKIIKPAHNSSELITVSIYAHIRHPMYAIWGLAILPGIFFLLNSWIFFIILPVYYIIVRLFIQQEERFLLRRYGQEYIQYKKNVNAFFPKLKKFKPN